MVKKSFDPVTLKLDAFISGGQTIGTLDSGKKALVWGGLPGETVVVGPTKSKSSFIEGIIQEVLKASPDRIEPRDPATYLSTSPWQIMTFAAEQAAKATLIEEAFTMHSVQLPAKSTIYSDDQQWNYRNKVEFSWYSDFDEDSGSDSLDLAFFRRGGKGKIPLDQCSLLPDAMMNAARQVRDILHSKQVSARQLKTLMIRIDETGLVVWQLYVKDLDFDELSADDFAKTGAKGAEIIYSDPRSPASRITQRLASFGDTTLIDTILDIPFRYVAEGFFQINLPVYQQALRDMKQFVPVDKPLLDMYAGVGTIGLTIGTEQTELVEINREAVIEMCRNIEQLESSAEAILAPSEKALELVTSDKTIIVDPPRAGLHANVVTKLLKAKPERIIYLSCNPVTQARDVAGLLAGYRITHHKGYNFFPRTPHIENLIILDRLPKSNQS